MAHANAPLTPLGRTRRATLINTQGWTVRRAAERFQVSPATASKWALRQRQENPMTDLSSRPHTSPTRLAPKTERRILALRFTRRWGPHRISYHLRVNRSTIERVLHRYRMPILEHIDQATGLAVRQVSPVRYERARPGDLVHVDIKKQGRIPPGGGHRMVERFSRTLAQEWAYARAYASEEELAGAYGAWLHYYNHHRPHTGIGGSTPAQRVHNLAGKYS